MKHANDVKHAETHSMSGDPVETICVAYGEAIALYCRARALAESFLGQLNAGQSEMSLLQQLQQMLDQAETAKAQAAAALAEMGTRPPPTVEVVLGQTRDLMLEIVDRVRRAETQAVAVLEELAPQLEVASKGRQMHRAYSANS